MLKHAAVVFVVISSIIPVTLQATPIEYDFRAPSIEDLDGGAQLVLIRNDITLTAATGDGVLNRTAAGFGVNAFGSGDDTSTLDGGSGAPESVGFRFDSDVLLNGFSVSAFGSADIGSYRVGGLPLVEFTTTGFNSLEDVLLPAGNGLTLFYTDGNGFSLDSLFIRAFGAPEPETLALLALSLCLIGFRPWYRGYDTGALPV